MHTHYAMFNCALSNCHECTQVFCIPFVWTHPSVSSEPMSEIDWVGTVPVASMASYIDVYLLVIFGGIPWQVTGATNTISAETTFIA